MYEYPELDKFEKIMPELRKAAMHDPVLHQCYQSYLHIKGDVSEPFRHREFFEYLSYTALKAHARVFKNLLEQAHLSINPPIILQQLGDDKVYNKDHIDRLLRKETKGYWQKLWAAIRGR